MSAKKKAALRLVTWNINSVRLRLPLLARLKAALDPDIICLQETKCEDRHFPHEGIAALGFAHRQICGNKGYNGVAILASAAGAGRDAGLVRTHRRTAHGGQRQLAGTSRHDP